MGNFVCNLSALRMLTNEDFIKLYVFQSRTPILVINEKLVKLYVFKIEFQVSYGFNISIINHL